MARDPFQSLADWHAVPFELKPLVDLGPNPPWDPPWLVAALGELGVREVPGQRDNPRIREYHSETGAGEAPDEVPWCSSFVNWCLAQAALRGTRSKAARSWLTWSRGITIAGPRRGALVVFERGQYPAGHVAFELDGHGDRIWVVGGNQSNEVCERAYPASALLGRIWPAG